jgi:hypothetical protein
MGVFQKLLCQIRLWLWQSSFKVSNCSTLATIQARINLDL